MLRLKQIVTGFVAERTAGLKGYHRLEKDMPPGASSATAALPQSPTTRSAAIVASALVPTLPRADARHAEGSFSNSDESSPAVTIFDGFEEFAPATSGSSTNANNQPKNTNTKKETLATRLSQECFSLENRAGLLWRMRLGKLEQLQSIFPIEPSTENLAFNGEQNREQRIAEVIRFAHQKRVVLMTLRNNLLNYQELTPHGKEDPDCAKHALLSNKENSTECKKIFEEIVGVFLSQKSPKLTKDFIEIAKYGIKIGALKLYHIFPVFNPKTHPEYLQDYTDILIACIQHLEGDACEQLTEEEKKWSYAFIYQRLAFYGLKENSYILQAYTRLCLETFPGKNAALKLEVALWHLDLNLQEHLTAYAEIVNALNNT